MKSKTRFFGLVCLLCAVTIAGQKQGAAQAQKGPATDTVAPDIPGVVRGGTVVKVVKDGFTATDGPVPLPDGSLIFWDFPSRHIVKIDKDGNASTFLTQGMGVGRNGAQAITVDSKGRIITLDKDKTSTRIAVVYPPGSEKVLVDTCEGKPMSEANDLIADKKGGVFFTDQDGFVFYGRPDGTCVKVQTETDRLNGIILSRDEKTLYVTTQGRTAREALTSADLKTDGGNTLLAFDIQPDGTLRNRRIFAQYEFINRRPEGLPDQRFGGDGITIDSQERLYATTAAGIQVFSPHGKLLGTIPVSRNPQNLAFAGPDKKALYITARGAIYKIEMLSQGFKGRPK